MLASPLCLQNQQVCQKRKITCTAHTDNKLINWSGHTATACYHPSRWQVFSKAVHQNARQLSSATVKSYLHLLQSGFTSSLYLYCPHWPMSDSQSHLQLLLQYIATMMIQPLMTIARILWRTTSHDTVWQHSVKNSMLQSCILWAVTQKMSQ